MRRRALTLLIVVLVAAAAYAAARSRRDFWDFEVYRRAAVRALAAEPLYRADDGHYQFKYWPAFALAMAPFGRLDPELGKVIWYTLTVACIGVFIERSIVLLPGRRSSTRWLAWLTLLFTGKFIVKELVNGQTNALFGVLAMAALASAAAGRPLRAGALVGIAAFVKPYAVLFVPWLAAAVGLRAAAASIAVLMGGWLLPAAVYGWQGNLDLLRAWYATVVETTPANLLFPENISIAAFWAKWIGPGPRASLLTIAAVAACLVGAAYAWAARRRVDEPEYLELAYLLLLVPLVSPQGWDYVLLLGVPAIVCLLDRLRDRSTAWRTVTLAGLLLTSFTIYDLLGRSAYLALMSWSVVTAGALLAAVSLLQLRRSAAV
jgi:hypothetical protein